MGETSRYAWPYPEQSNSPDVPGDLQALATSLEETVGGLDDAVTTLTGMSQSIMQYTVLTRVSSSILTVPNAQWYAITWDAAQWNKPESDPAFVLASPTRITIKSTGIYRIQGFAGFALNSAGSRAVAVRVNGNPSYTAITSGDLPPGDIEWYGSVCVDARVNKNDFLELVVRQTSGGPLKLDTVKPRFSVQQMAAL